MSYLHTFAAFTSHPSPFGVRTSISGLEVTPLNKAATGSNRCKTDTKRAPFSSYLFPVFNAAKTAGLVGLGGLWRGGESARTTKK